MEGIPTNTWYVVALSSEITSTPLARTVAGEALALYRLADGRPVALRDRCSHRRFPLSMAKLAGDTLVCSYHGFSYDGTGRCVAVPGQARIPARAGVEAFPLLEQGMWTWVWIGDEQPGDRLPPATPWIDGATGWVSRSGVAAVDCRHSLLVDNLLDLSHETYLHGGYIGTPEVASTPITTRVERERGVVSVSRHMHAAQCPPFYERTTGLSSPIDRWQDLEFFAPAFYLLHVRIAPAGTPIAADGADGNAFHLKILYGLTPSTEHRTYDFWAVSRDFALEDTEVGDYLDKMQWDIVQQDVDALNLLEQRVAADPDPFEVGVQVDRGPLAARRMVRDMAGSSPQR